MEKFRVELWRIVKFLLITAAVNLPLTILHGAIINGLVAAGHPSIGSALAALNYANILLSTTLLTLLTRLSEKGFVEIRKDGRRSHYTALISKEAYLAAQGRSFFQKLCGGSVSAFAVALSDSGLSREDLEELRALLERGQL